MQFEKGQKVWVGGMDKYGGYTAKGRKAIFNYPLQADCCIIKYADVKFRKGGIDSCSTTCLTSLLSAREESK